MANAQAKTATVKFLCSYGGRILPRYPDGKLRYHGGDTRVLSVPRSVSFSEVVSKLGDMCGTPVSLRCQLPAEDLDALVTVTSDEDLANLMEEYDRASPAPKIRAFLSPVKPAAGKNTAAATTSSPRKSSSRSPPAMTPRVPAMAAAKPRAATCLLCLERSAERMRNYGCYAHRNPTHLYLIHNGNHWQ